MAIPKPLTRSAATAQVQSELVLHLQSGTRLLQIVSLEWERINGFITNAIKQSGQRRRFLRWTYPDGLQEYDFGDRRSWYPEDELPEDVKEAIALPPQQILEWYLGVRGGPDFNQSSVLYFEDFHLCIREAKEERDALLWLLRKAARMDGEAKRTIILGTAVECLPIELEKEMPLVDVPLPDEPTLKSVLTSVAFDTFGLPEDRVETSLRILESAKGLTAMEAEVAFAKAIALKGRITEAEIDIINAEKRQIIRKSGILEFFQPREGMADVGGLNCLKHWFAARQESFGQEARDYGLTPPKGVLLLGLPGCGKSLTAKAVAAQWRFPLVRFDLGKVFGGLVGESERNIRTALKTATAVAPCILWIDEIEKGLSGSQSSGSTDGGTAARVFGTFLTWMQEKEEPVFVLATSNNIESLPPEMLRKGRFDEIFFVDLPSATVRAEIFEIHVRRNYRHQDSAHFDFAALAQKTSGFSGAEIEQVVKDAMFTAFSQGQRSLRTDDILAAIEATYPLSKTMGENLNRLRSWAKARARMASDDPFENVPASDTKVPRLRSEKKNIFEDD